MASNKKRKKYSVPSDIQTELNVMPFVDIFSLLCTFLLFTAVFVSIAIHEVQVPFFSNAAPAREQKQERSLIVNIHLNKNEIALSTAYTRPPQSEDKKIFPRTDEGLRQFHQELVQLRRTNQNSDKATLFVEDSITYAELVSVLDQIKLLLPADEGFQASAQASAQGSGGAQRREDGLFSKVVMGDVVL